MPRKGKSREAEDRAAGAASTAPARDGSIVVAQREVRHPPDPAVGHATPRAGQSARPASEGGERGRTAEARRPRPARGRCGLPSGHSGGPATPGKRVMAAAPRPVCFARWTAAPLPDHTASMRHGLFALAHGTSVPTSARPNPSHNIVVGAVAPRVRRRDPFIDRSQPVTCAPTCPGHRGQGTPTLVRSPDRLPAPRGPRASGFRLRCGY